MENDVEDHQQKTDPSKESSSEPGFFSEQQQEQQIIPVLEQYSITKEATTEEAKNRKEMGHPRQRQ